MSTSNSSASGFTAGVILNGLLGLAMLRAGDGGCDRRSYAQRRLLAFTAAPPLLFPTCCRSLKLCRFPGDTDRRIDGDDLLGVIFFFFFDFFPVDFPFPLGVLRPDVDLGVKNALDFVAVRFFPLPGVFGAPTLPGENSLLTEPSIHCVVLSSVDKLFLPIPPQSMEWECCGDPTSELASRWGVDTLFFRFSFKRFNDIRVMAVVVAAAAVCVCRNAKGV